jgi:DNA-binding XRE family transcriptional regulator
MVRKTKEIADLQERVKARQELPPKDERRAIRERAGESKRGVAKAVGCSVQAIIYWEKGTREPRGKHLPAYVRVLKALQEATASAEPKLEADVDVERTRELA